MAAELKHGTFPFADIEAYYQLYEPAKADSPTVLFLHGMKFTSDNWVSIGSMSKVHDKGWRTIAVDLPGYGKTKALPYVDNNMRAEFVKACFEFAGKGLNLTATGAALVTPSMSGRWAIPFLDRYGTLLKAWVAVAPVGVNSWGGPWEYTHKRVSLLAVYGERDEMQDDAENLMKLFRHSEKKIIPNAGHACYIDQTDAFHKLLTPFLVDSLQEKNEH